MAIPVNSRMAPRLVVVSIAFSATVTPNCDTTELLRIGTLTAPVTIAAPTGTPIDGQQLNLSFVQDATGRAFIWNSTYAFGTDITEAMIPITPSAKFEVMFRYNSTDSKWRCMSLIRGF